MTLIAGRAFLAPCRLGSGAQHLPRPGRDRLSRGENYEARAKKYLAGIAQKLRDVGLEVEAYIPWGTEVVDSMKPVVNKRKCPAQANICTVIKTCPYGAIRYVEDVQEPLGGRIVIDEALCDGCGLCASECCGHAIEMV